MQRKVIYVDVDDTLVRSVGSKRIPIPSVVSAVRHWKRQGYQLFLWSSGGAAYSRDTATELGIVECFEGFLPKPQVYVDDQAVHQWRYCTHQHPNSVSQAET